VFLLDRRRIGIVLAVTAAAALVGIAAGGDHRRRGAQRIPETVSTTTQAMLIILFVLLAAGVLALTLWAITPDDLAGPLDRRRRTRSMVGTLVGLVLLMAAFSWAGRGGDDDEDEARPSIAVPALPSPGEVDVEDRPEPSWGLGLAGVVVLLGAAAVIARRRRVAPLDLPDGPLPVIATEDERVDAVRAAEACTDPRQAVLLAFAAAEALLSADVATRRPPATSAREWASALGLRPLTTIVGRYEVARFSHHDVDDSDRRDALDALRELA
jgi:hypothetical protein